MHDIVRDQSDGKAAGTRTASNVAVRPDAYVIERREQRFLLRSDAERSALESNLRRFRRSEYAVRTIYLGGLGGAKLRLREYDCSGIWWLEQKMRTRDFVRKRRYRLGAMDATALASVAEVTYWRTAYESDLVRVTIDTDLLSADGYFEASVVELKGSYHVDPALFGLADGAPRFSKFRWARGAFVLDEDRTPAAT
jgi:hypothetical protein